MPIFLVLNLIIFLENLPWEAQFSKPAMTPPSPLSLPDTATHCLGRTYYA